MAEGLPPRDPPRYLTEKQLILSLRNDIPMASRPQFRENMERRLRVLEARNPDV